MTWEKSRMLHSRFIDKSTDKVNLPQKTIEGVVHLQPRLHAPVDSLPTLIVVVTFPVTYLKVVLPCLPPLQSTVVAPQTKHVQDVQRVRMKSVLPFVVPLPDCPRVQAAFCAGLLHPEGADRVIPLPSVKYGLEVVLPNLAEIPTLQALLKEGALQQPAKHPLLSDSQYLWQVRLVQQKEFGSCKAHQTSRAIIPLTKAKVNPLHSALRTDFACSLLSLDELRRIYVEERPVKATNRGQSWKEAEPRLTSSSESTTTSTKSAPRPEWGKNLQTIMLENRQGNMKSWHIDGKKKHPDDADHWTGQQWSQRTRNAEWVEGWHKPASSSFSQWHSQR